ncbi:hypothetical protein cypCar_00047890, partial [Cyprinus carpio]
GAVAQSGGDLSSSLGAGRRWLPLWKFESFVDFLMGATLLLKNPVTDLCELQPGDWIQQDKGLCKTCEIFGAKALVLDSLRHVNDKQFQALSVSSELWLLMLEPAELSDFLQLKKREGYWVIGMEQTSNSQSLQDYTFPDRSLLLPLE